MYQQNGLNAIFDSYSAKLNVSNSKGQSLNAYMDAVPYPLCKNYLVSSFFDRNFQWIASLVVFLTNYIFFLSADSNNWQNAEGFESLQCQINRELGRKAVELG